MNRRHLVVLAVVVGAPAALGSAFAWNSETLQTQSIEASLTPQATESPQSVEFWALADSGQESPTPDAALPAPVQERSAQPLDEDIADLPVVPALPQPAEPEDLRSVPLPSPTEPQRGRLREMEEPQRWGRRSLSNSSTKADDILPPMSDAPVESGSLPARTPATQSISDVRPESAVRSMPDERLEFDESLPLRTPSSSPNPVRPAASVLPSPLLSRENRDPFNLDESAIAERCRVLAKAIVDSDGNLEHHEAFEIYDTEIKGNLKRLFDLRQQRYDTEVKELEAKIQSLQNLVQRRQTARSEIIEKRYQQLLREAEGLGW